MAIHEVTASLSYGLGLFALMNSSSHKLLTISMLTRHLRLGGCPGIAPVARIVMN